MQGTKVKFALVKFALVKFALVGVIFTQNYARAHRALPPQKKNFRERHAAAAAVAAADKTTRGETGSYE